MQGGRGLSLGVQGGQRAAPKKGVVLISVLRTKANDHVVLPLFWKAAGKAVVPFFQPTHLTKAAAATASTQAYLLCARHTSKCVTAKVIESLQKFYEVVPIIIPIVQMSKLRFPRD